jgi:hypothetical protein
MAVGHALEDVLEVGKGLYVVELCGGDKGADGGPADAAAIGASEQVVLAAKCNRSDCAFDGKRSNLVRPLRDLCISPVALGRA